MNSKVFKISLILASFIFLSGFLPFSAFVGPGITVASTGNVYKASAQYLIDNHVKNKTGKNSLTYVKDGVTKYSKQENLNNDLKKLIETRVQETHKKLIKQTKENNSNKEFRKIVEKRIKLVSKKLDIKKINQ